MAVVKVEGLGFGDEGAGFGRIRVLKGGGLNPKS